VDMEDWEKEAEAPAPVSKPKALNPGATSFVFNPGASSFTPTAPAPPAPPAPAAAAAADGAEGDGEEEEEIDENDPLWKVTLELAGGDRKKAIEMLEDPDELESNPKVQAALGGSGTEWGDGSAQVTGNETWEEPTAAAGGGGSGAGASGGGAAGDKPAAAFGGGGPSKGAAAEEEEPFMPPQEETEGDSREHLNIVFIGHVDAGKSTLSGNLLYLTDHVDRRTIEKYEREAKQRNRESWFLAFIMDTNEEERQKGKTVEVGRAHLATDSKRYTILDAPGHKSYVPNMIAGASQADIGILVISARTNEFESGFERGGQTREHAMLAKTLGVKCLIVVVNKMDDPTVKWAKKRYDEIVGKLKPFLKSCGFLVKKEVKFIPISALTGANILKPVDPAQCPWWRGMVAEGANNTMDGELLTCLDRLSIADRDPSAPLRIPVLDRFYDRGTVIIGKVESGTLSKGDRLSIMPTGVTTTVDSLISDEVPVRSAKPGDNVEVRCGLGLDAVAKGFVICNPTKEATATDRFLCQLFLVDLPETRPLFTAGYDCMLHVHTCETEVVVNKLLTILDPKTKTEKRNPRFAKQGSQITCELAIPQTIVVAPFEEQQQLGRFTLRDEGKSIAIGKILRLL